LNCIFGTNYGKRGFGFCSHLCYDNRIRAGFENTGYYDRFGIRGIEVEEHEKDIVLSIISRRYSDSLSNRQPGG
jgi:hypothetical protein